MLTRSFLVLGLLTSCGVCAADITLQAATTADNSFTAYLSTSPGTPGTPFLTGNSWGTTFTGSSLLTTPGTYYLQVHAIDQGPPAMFIGRFTLDNAQATFANGTQTLVTNSADWFASTAGFGVGNASPTTLGPNGMGPWGLFPAMDNGSFVWAPNAEAATETYFWTPITVVPAPGAAAALGAGLMLLRRRR